MPTREIDGFEVWSAARQLGDEQAIPEVEVKDLSGKLKSNVFSVHTTERFDRLEDAKAAADDVVGAIERVDERGVPSPLTYPTRT